MFGDRRTAGERGLLLAGLAISAGGLAHAFSGWPTLSRELTGQGASADLVGALAVGWMFGSGAMVTLGVVVLLGRADLKRGGSLGGAMCFAVGLLYLLFGLAASVYRYPSPHFLGFVALGLLVLLSAWAAARR